MLSVINFYSVERDIFAPSAIPSQVGIALNALLALREMSKVIIFEIPTVKT